MPQDRKSISWTNVMVKMTDEQIKTRENGQRLTWLRKVWT